MSQCSAGVRAKFPNRCPLFATNGEDWGPVFFFGPFRARLSCATDPGLAPWAAFLRRCAAIELSSATWNKRCDECHSAARVSEQNSRIGAHCSRRTRRIGDLCFSFALSGLDFLAPLTQGLRPGLHSCATDPGRKPWVPFQKQEQALQGRKIIAATPFVVRDAFFFRNATNPS